MVSIVCGATAGSSWLQDLWNVGYQAWDPGSEVTGWSEAQLHIM